MPGWLNESSPPFVTSGRARCAVLLAGLYRDSDLLGFLALGYGPTRDPAAGETLDQLNAIVEHATIALRNAQLLEDARQASVKKSYDSAPPRPRGGRRYCKSW